MLVVPYLSFNEEETREAPPSAIYSKLIVLNVGMALWWGWE